MFSLTKTHRTRPFSGAKARQRIGHTSIQAICLSHFCRKHIMKLSATSTSTPSTWDGAGQVIEEMRRRGLMVYTTHYPDGQVMAQIVRDSLETLGDAQASPEPHAITVAAILALRSEAEHGDVR